ncbi:MAG: heme biosynthesis protein HemY [Hydrogenophilales bacterium CG_4_9_14_3_um_filter_59_35]|nr:MAG: heme biosynthesis protein HemY [Hydrogenophilales bacterium CG18_big_fil_WC_8_21_14_2_50_58_12]PIX99515.1 MAG: heme biosynthesis protein HemY [Hydrogenophilales bacterium CG_4_10_14_3_um_filter_58_23]PJB05432.1 MAG: heme biosynthesis protein HemY [Hydrogenophilales bacterium CG_4_9_14_3_um_filter_59_35]
MKVLFWILAILAAAVALTLAAKHNAGYVLLVYSPYRIELSLNLFLTLLLAIFAAGYGAVRLAVHTLNLPAYVRTFRQERRRDRAREAMDDALLAFYEGRYAKAEKFAVIALESQEAPLANVLLAARAAHELKAYDRRDSYLEQAERVSREQPEPRLMTQAELSLDQRDFQQALQSLKELQTTTRKNLAALRLELRAQSQAKNWDQVLVLVAQLERRGAIDPIQASQQKISAYQENLKRKGQDLASLREYWQKIPSTDKTNSKIAWTAAQGFLAFRECQAAMEIITASLESQWDSDVVRLYGECLGKETLKQIERAEKWLKQHPQDAVLLQTLGRLCAKQELWGKAQSYLEASLSIEPNAGTHLELAHLLEKIGRADEAGKHYRASMVMLQQHN